VSGSNLYASLSSLLAAAVAIAIGVSVFLRDRSRDQFRLFAGFCLNLGLFHLARFFAGFPALPLSIWIAQTFSLFLPYTADRCFSGFIPASGAPPRNVVQAPMLALLLIAQTLALIFPTLPDEPWWVIVSTLLPAYVIGGLLYAAMRMWRAARAAEGTAAAPRLRYLFYASLLALALGQPGIPVVGATFTAVYLYFMAQTLVRERLLDLPEILGRITVMTLLVITVTAVYAALLLWVPWRFADEPMLLVFNTLLASFAVLMLVDPLRTELERRLEGWVFRERSALRAILVQLRQRLANVIDPDEMVKAVLGSLRESNRVTRAAFFLVDRQGLALTLRGHLGAPVLERLDLATRRPLLERLRQGPQLRDVLQRQRERARSELQAELDESLQTLAEIGASLALPVLGRNTTDDGQAVFDLLGVLFVEDERLLEPFSREEVELFAGVVAQAAVMIENSKVYEQRKERDRLAALGQMAAGLAHEIRNPLGAIKGAVQVVEPGMKGADPTTREFLGVIVEEVDRLNRVVTQFLSYSRPFSGEMSAVTVPDVVAATLRLLPEENRQRVTVTCPPNLPRVRGDAEALRQVLLNLLRNAFDALDGTPRPPAGSGSPSRCAAMASPAGTPSPSASATTDPDSPPRPSPTCSSPSTPPRAAAPAWACPSRSGSWRITAASSRPAPPRVAAPSSPSSSRSSPCPAPPPRPDLSFQP
jgi:two-component system sensor histidine kinase HydH